MSLTVHPDIDVMSGTDWSIAGNLFDANGNPLDVTNATLSWVLLDPDGNPILPIDTNVTITKTDPVNGAIQVTVPNQYTYLRPGRYTDALQVIEGTSTDVFWTGQLRVAANPFNVYGNITELPLPPPAPTPTPDSDQIIVIPPWWVFPPFNTGWWY